MTLGEFPDKVQPEFRLDLARFFNSEFEIGKFRDIGHIVGVNRFNQAGGAIMDDFDNDGLLDIAVTSFDATEPMAVYRNKGDGTFEDRSEQSRLAGQFGGMVCYQADYNNDGGLDIFIPRGAWVTWPVRPTLLRNDGAGGFSDVTRDAGLLTPVNSIAACWGDYDNDGWIDLFVGCERQENRLYHNKGNGCFEEVAARADVQGQPKRCCKGCTWIDFDNDGFLDMYLGTGEPNLATLIPNRMFKNVGGTRFAEITASAGTGHLQKGHGVAIGDWDRDGDVDLFVETGGTTNGDKYHNILFQNPGQGNHWLTVKLVGKKTNRAAIGARIKLVTAGENPLTIHRHVSSGSSFGGNPLQQTIGLAKARQVALLEIRWPTSGTTQVFHDLAADQAIEVSEFAESCRPLAWKAIPQPK